MTKTTEEAKNSAELKRSYLMGQYNRQYKEWNGLFSDDRQIFCNIYEKLIEALDEMEKIKSLTIWVGFNNEFKEQETVLAKIQNTFTN